MTKQYPIIFSDFSIEGLKKQWEYQQKLGKLIRNSDASDSEGRLYLHHRVIPKPSVIGCKTETRRLTGLKEINKNPDEWLISCHGIYTGGKYYVEFAKKDKLSERTKIKCPYGSAGDELWVRESFHKYTSSDKIDMPVIYSYKADNPITSNAPIWKSPLFMPKEASRITLEITGISVERLQDITEEGALREGVTEKWNEIITFPKLDNKQIKTETYAAGYAKKWAELHGKESWNNSPWVWVIRFSVLSFREN